MIRPKSYQVYLLFASDDGTSAYEVHHPDINEKLEPYSRLSFGYGIVPVKEVTLTVSGDPVKIEFDEKMLERLARYNLEQTNKTLIREIEYRESRLEDIKSEIKRLQDVLEKAKEIAKDMVDGAEYFRKNDFDE